MAFTHDSLAGSGSGRPLVLVQEVGPHEGRRTAPPSPPPSAAPWPRPTRSARAPWCWWRAAASPAPRAAGAPSTCRDAWAAGTLATAARRPAWRAASAAAEAAPVPPRDPVEQACVEIWRELLGHERFGVHDHFFALGGNSLTATQVAARLRARSGVELPLAVLFEHPPWPNSGALRTVGGDAAAHAAPFRPCRWRGHAGQLLAAAHGLVQQMNPRAPPTTCRWWLRLRGALDRYGAARGARRPKCPPRRYSAPASRCATGGSQRFEPDAAAPWRELDLSALPTAERAARLQREVARRGRACLRPRPRRAAPPAVPATPRGRRACNGAGSPSLIADQWSAMVLSARELAELYEARCEVRAAAPDATSASTGRLRRLAAAQPPPAPAAAASATTGARGWPA